MRLTVRQVGSSIALAALAAFAGCAEPVDDIDRTQPNALSKEMFRGEWFFARTVVDAPYESEWTFVGDRQEYLLQEDFPAYKIRWRIEEKLLMACRVDDIVMGADTARSGDRTPEDHKATARARNDAEGDDWQKFPCHHPIAAFNIEGHFDIRRDYNAMTGEQSNVIVENTVDRPWHERNYMRVDWTDIGVTELNFNLQGFARIGFLKIDNAYFVQEEDGDCGQSVDGRRDFSNCDEGFLPPLIEPDSINITNRMVVAPGDGLIECFYGWTKHCTLTEIGMRYSFMRVPERMLKPETHPEAYEPLYYPEKMFERYGIWRVIKPVYVPGRGETDFKEFLGTRWQLWKETQRCEGGTCTPIPLSEREIRPIVYYLNRGFPVDLKPTAFKIAKEWNDAYAGIRPGIDLKTSCRVVCADGREASACAATDPNWRMEGTCAFELRENSGEEFLGDLRYNFIAFVENAGMRQPCGVGGPANDPETGELINATSYVYGAGCFDFLENRIMDMLDILCAQKRSEGGNQMPAACDDISEDEYTRGIRMLEIMHGQGKTQAPVLPIRGMGRVQQRLGQVETRERLGEMRERAEEMRRNRGGMASRAKALANHGIDRALIPDDLARELSGGRAGSAADLTDDEVALFNPLNPTKGLLADLDRHRDFLTSRAVEPADFIFQDSALWHFAQRNLTLSRGDLRQLLRQEAFRSVTLHELGHNMGLRHNFISSFDRTNYFPKYWELKAQVERNFAEVHGRPAPTFQPFQSSDETEDQLRERYLQWEQDRQIIREMFSQSGIREYRYSSIMDYSGLYYNDWQGLGSYDTAAMRFMYAGLVDRTDCEGSRPEQCATAARYPVPFYLGGEMCDSDDDCPNSSRGQRCRLDARTNGHVGVKFCSNWDDDERASGRFNTKHQFCSDDRVADQPFCNRFDEGESSEEIVRNMIENYERSYVFNNFRRYSDSFSAQAYFQRIFQRHFAVIGDQMQSLLYKYFYEPGFLQNDGPGGFYDMFRATVIGFDFLANVLMRPEPGPYEWNAVTGLYEALNNYDVVPDSDKHINVTLGQGKMIYSSYETGYFGEIERLAYVGTFYDKIAAVLTLTLRDWGASALANEQRFILNFQDFFPLAEIDVLGSLIAGDMAPGAHYYDDQTGTLHQQSFWDGTFFGDEGAYDPRAELPPGRPIRSQLVQLDQVALIYGILYVPYFGDLGFLNSTRVFEVGGNTGFSLSGIDSADVNLCTSPLTQRTFAAVRTTAIRSIGWRAIDRCRELAEQYTLFDDALKNNVMPNGMSRGQVERERRLARGRMETQEDRLSNIVYIYNIVGIGSL